MQWSNPPRSNFLCSITAGLLGPGVVISSLVWMTPAIAQQVLSSWQYDPLTQQFTVTLPQGVTPQYSVLAEAGQIRLDLPQTQLGAVPTDATYQGVVRQISLSQLNDETVRVVFTLDPGVELEGDPLQLVAVAAGDQTRWVFSPLAHRAEPRGRAETVPGGMIVELPTLPPDPNLSWPYTGIGRLSISATNLMLPETLDSFNNLPETLAIDPFNLGLPAGDPVSVPSLAELDAAIGVAIAPSTSATANGTAGAAIALPPPLDRPGPGNPVAVAPLPNPAEGAEVTPPVATEPRPEPMSSVALTPPPRSTPVIETPPGLAPAPTPAPFRPEVAPLPETALAPTLAQPALEQPTIDQDQGGLAIPVTPPVPATRPLSPPATPEVNPRDAIAVSPPRPQPTPSQAVAETETPAPAIATAPPGGFGASTPPSPSPRVIGAAPIAQPPPANATAPSTPVAPPFIAVEPTPAPDSRLAVPSLPTTTSTGTVVPPTFAIEPEPVLMAAEASIAFGQPLPGASKAVEASPPPASGDRNLSPDILIASGTVLELRYTGSQPLTLDPNTRLNEVLILETEIRDPITNGVLAPAGSQLIGQFDNHAQNQQWVSQMLIVPTGQRVPFASTSEYLVGSPQVSGSRLALGTGIGALALTLLTGFSGVGLLGGAFLGATTVVGTSPQVVVIQPNQIIYAQVTQDIPRSMPIAAAPLAVAEWGTTPSTW